MTDIAVQLAAAQAISQYESAAASAGTAGSTLFAETLKAAEAAADTAAAEASASETAPAATAQQSGTSMLSSLIPFFLASMASGSGGQAMLMVLVAALLEKNGGGSLLDDSGLMDSFASAGLGSSSLLSLFGGDMFGTTGSSDDIWGSSSAATQATMMTAQSLLKAYSNVAANNASGSSLGTALASSVASQRGASGAAAADVSGKAVGSGNGPGARVTPEITSTVSNRSASLYRAVIDQFDVEDNPRYEINQKGEGDTYCNIFMWDVTSAMGAEVPYHTDKDTGAPLSSGSSENAVSMNANRMSDWLNTYGEKYGWYEVTAEQAQALANRGCPAVTIWKNPTGGHGHAQVVSPSEDGRYDPARGVAIAQAGASLHNYTYIRDIYTTRMETVQYFAHL